MGVIVTIIRSQYKMALDIDFDILPIESHKDELLSAIQSNQYLICLGETGSGKILILNTPSNIQ